VAIIWFTQEHDAKLCFITYSSTLWEVFLQRKQTPFHCHRCDKIKVTPVCALDLFNVIIINLET